MAGPLKSPGKSPRPRLQAVLVLTTRWLLISRCRLLSVPFDAFVVLLFAIMNPILTSLQ